MKRKRITIVINKGIVWRTFTDIPKTELDLELIDLDGDDFQANQDCKKRIAQIEADKTMREVSGDEW
jgi:hypothetical protein